MSIDLKRLNDLVWNEKFWLPKNINWPSLNQFRRLDVNHVLLYPVLCGVIIYIVRILFENLIAKPVGRLLGIAEWPIKFKPNALLEAYYRTQAEPDEKTLIHISKQHNRSMSFVRGWFQWRASLKKAKKINKFSETFWRFTFYLGIWLYGLNTLYNEPWLWDVEKCFVNYPKQVVSERVYWYYAIEVGFYLSLIVSQFSDVKRKDFWQMFLHHIVTISLILFSYMCNFVRVGAIILLLHDTTDYWLELAKMGTYAPKLSSIRDSVFVIFTLCWFITRLVAFPLIILNLTTFKAPNLMGLFPAYYVFNGLLYVLQVMHVLWFYMILRVASRALKSGQVEKDDRSEESSDELEDQEETQKKSN